MLVYCHDAHVPKSPRQRNQLLINVAPGSFKSSSEDRRVRGERILRPRGESRVPWRSVLPTVRPFGGQRCTSNAARNRLTLLLQTSVAGRIALISDGPTEVRLWESQSHAGPIWWRARRRYLRDRGADRVAAGDAGGRRVLRGGAPGRGGGEAAEDAARSARTPAGRERPHCPSARPGYRGPLAASIRRSARCGQRSAATSNYP